LVGALWRPAEHRLTFIPLALAVVAAECWGAARWRRATLAQPNAPPPASLPVTPPSRAVDESAEEDELVQQFVRRRSARGDELAGRIRVEFPLGAKHAVTHLAFCPPFARTPRIELGPAADAPASATVTQVFPHGARIEVKRRSAVTASVLWLQVAARCAPSHEAWDQPLDQGGHSFTDAAERAAPAPP
jgi:hypothetical protein